MCLCCCRTSHRHGTRACVCVRVHDTLTMCAQRVTVASRHALVRSERMGQLRGV
jgi:hypothetical protein